jgi:Cellulose binding domain
VTGEGSRRPRDSRGRLVIDLRTPPGALSRSDLRRLREELELEAMAYEPGDDEPAPAPTGRHDDGTVTGRHRTAGLRPRDEYPPPEYQRGDYPPTPYPSDPYPSDPYPSDPYPSDPYPSDPYPPDPYPSDPYPSDPYSPRNDDREGYPWPGSRARSPLLPPRRSRGPEPEPRRPPSPLRSPRTGRAMEPPPWAETHGRRSDTDGWQTSRAGLPDADLEADDVMADLEGLDDVEPDAWPGLEPDAAWWDDDEGFPLPRHSTGSLPVAHEPDTRPLARRPQPVTMRFAEDAGLHELRRDAARPPADRGARPPADRGAWEPDPPRRPPSRPPARSSGGGAPHGERSRLRPALLIRATVVIGLLAALAASIDRADQHPSSGNAGVAQGTLGELQAGGTTLGTGADPAAKQPTVATSTAPVMPSAPPGTVTALPVTTTGDGDGQSGAPPPAPCHISYSVTLGTTDQFTVVMVIANTSNTKVNGWTLRWQYPPTQKILYGWNAMVAVGATGTAATGIGADQTIAPGGSVTIGFVGQRGVWVPTPTGFALNGQTCQWQPAVASMTPNP